MDVLRRDMEVASGALEFERAAVLRDKLQRLEGLREQFMKFRFAVETLSFVYTVPGYDGDDRVYLIRRGRVRGEHTLPRSEQDRMRLLEMLDDVFSPAGGVTRGGRAVAVVIVVPTLPRRADALASRARVRGRSAPARIRPGQRSVVRRRDRVPRRLVTRITSARVVQAMASLLQPSLTSADSRATGAVMQ